MDNTQHLRRTASPAAVIRGAALDAAIRWFNQETSRVESLNQYQLPKKSKTPSEDEMTWNVCRFLYAQNTHYSLDDSDHALRTDFARYQGTIEALLKVWRINCLLQEEKTITGKEWYELCYLLMNNCGWPQDKVIAHVLLLHTKSCPHCGLSE